MNKGIKLPASKSLCNRALILDALAGGTAELGNISDCDDTVAVLTALAQEDSSIDVGAAGTAMRFLTAYFSQLEGERTITGSARMQERPIGILVEALRKIGADITYLNKEGFPPLQIKGKKLTGGKLKLNGEVSSQFISALLMIAPLMEKGIDLELEGKIASKPYVDMTIALMEHYGVSSSFQKSKIKVKPQAYVPTPYTVESDWSAASYWYELSAVSEKAYILKGLNRTSLQGDAVLVDMFKQMGVATIFLKDGVQLKKTSNLPKEIKLDFSDCPDLAQTLVLTACLLGIKFHFTGLKTLKIKETNRILALQNECRKLGFVLVEPAEGSLSWDGVTSKAEPAPVINTYEDHRMAMSFAPAVLQHRKLAIKDPMVVNKSYPNYWINLQSVGIVPSFVD